MKLGGRLISGLTALVMTAGAAAAADMPAMVAPAAPPPPPPIAAPAFDWGGLYVGGTVSRGIFAPIEVAAQVGYNFVNGRLVYGIEAGARIPPLGPPAVSLFVKGRVGLTLGQRALVYGLVAIEQPLFAGPPTLWMAGGGAAFGIRDNVSIFAEASVLGSFGGGCCGLLIQGGVNFHIGR